MLQPGANATIQASNITSNRAWSGGGGLCTEMADEQESHQTGWPFDRKTGLIVDSTHFEGNRGTGRHLFVGPYFELQINRSLDNLTLFSEGVTWKKRICDRGEYVASSKFCELCVSFKYSRADRHTYPDCLAAPKTAHSPGGAVVVPLGNHWHDVKPTTDGNVSLSIVTRCVCVRACCGSVVVGHCPCRPAT